MKILIIHHHLKPGGVTRIIQSQIDSIKEIFTDISILTGYVDEKDTQFFAPAKVFVEEEIDYISENEINADNIKNKVSDISKIIKQHVTTSDIIHVHNLNLGKNPTLTIAINQLLNEGYRIFHHCHDFAEDRPANLNFLKYTIEELWNSRLNDVLYPNHKNYKLAVLNRFDFDRTKEIFPRENLFFLPNPVSVKVGKDDKPKAREKIVEVFDLDINKNIITYPVRVIRRKNVGELILLSALHQSAIFLVTLAPKNPDEIVFYDKWKYFCKENNINIYFEAGEKLDFETIISGSDFCITTSTKEGFGMTYLEPWLLNTPVVGRKIPEIVTDFEKDGIIFPKLYHSIKIPAIENDFSELSDDEKQNIILKTINNADYKNQILEHNKIVAQLFDDIPSQTIENNKIKITNTFSIKSYGKRLQEIYKTFFE